MPFDRETCLRAWRARDARFDGRFFVGVRSTGIFCRPVCPARPRPENCLFFPTAAAAFEAGLRPCLRCRPEAAPGSPAWCGTSSTVRRALRLIEEGALDRGNVGGLATRLGIGERHLRRLFLEHVGASPLAVAQARRLLFAKRLIDGTRLSMTDIAHASGYASVRRFNEAVRRAYGVAPSELRARVRRAGEPRAEGSPFALRLGFRAPYDWPFVLGYLAARATPGVERVAGGCYARSFALGDAVGVVDVACDDPAGQLVATVRLRTAATARAPSLLDLAERVRRLFDLAADPASIAERLRRDALLRRALRRHPGLRVPGAWSGFELAVRAILGQQVTVKGATTLAGRLARALGEPIEGSVAPAPRARRAADVDEADLVGAPVDRLFPRPEAVAAADVAAIGIPAARADAIRRLADAVANGALVLDGTAAPERTLDALRAIPGVGDWTAQYVAMRALAEPDAFPASDLGLRRALAPPGARRLPTAREVEQRSTAWRPYRAYAAVALWQLAGDAARDAT
ncbi:MAG: helix-turn-helix domain-containing protein [Myxococcales bacterium]|nr:helix-turn-helix domain-containing protein [Myxococcales bacterium]